MRVGLGGVKPLLLLLMMIDERTRGPAAAGGQEGVIGSVGVPGGFQAVLCCGWIWSRTVQRNCNLQHRSPWFVGPREIIDGPKSLNFLSERQSPMLSNYIHKIAFNIGYKGTHTGCSRLVLQLDCCSTRGRHPNTISLLRQHISAATIRFSINKSL